MKHLLFRVLKKLGLLQMMNLRISIRLAGERFLLPMLGNNGFFMIRLAEVEPWIRPILKTVLRHRQGTFLDVGVNLGQTLLNVKAIRRNQSYLGFEPNACCIPYLNELIRLNRLEQCEVIPAGLSDRADLVTLYNDEPTGSIASVVEGFRPDSFYGIRQRALLLEGDSTLDRLGVTALSVVKIDVEGGELEVLRGLRRSLRRLQPAVLCEFLPVIEGRPGCDTPRLRRFRQERQDEAVSMLGDLGYTMFRVLDQGKLERLHVIEPHSDLDLCNYVFVHRDQPWLIESLHPESSHLATPRPARVPIAVNEEIPAGS